MKLRRPAYLLCLLPLMWTACGGGSREPAIPPPPPMPERVEDVVPDAPARPEPKADASLIARDVLFGNPDRAQARLSPDGKQISFLAPADGVLNVWVGPAGDPAAAKPVTQEKSRGVRTYSWAYTNQHILYRQDSKGDENWHVHAVDLKSGGIKDLSPIEGVAARIYQTSPTIPIEVLVGLNDRDPKNHDVYRIDIRTGDKKLVFKNESGFMGFVADDALRVRLGLRQLPDGSTEYVDAQAKDPKAAPFMTVPHEDSMTTNPVGFDASGRTLLLLDSRGRNTAGLFAVDFATKKARLLAEDPKADIDEVIVHPRTRQVQAAGANFTRRTWQVIDKSIAGDLERLRKVTDGDIDVASRSLDDKQWIVAFIVSDGPVRYYRYDRTKKQATFLFTNTKALEGLKLAKMHPVVIESRDGLDLVSYLTLPPAADPDGDAHPDKPLAMVLFVHGGPWGRNEWGYSPTHQWLANRGYAVVSVNYRGSTGFGKAFVNAGDKQWAAKMHDDLIDVVRWAEREKVADPSRVAIMGGSYGGYATLVRLTFTPDTFACGVDIVGPPNLVTLLNTIPPYWAPMIEEFTRRVEDHRTEEGRKLLAERSPLTHVDRISLPLLIGQGANDPRVKQAESDQIVKAMQAKGIPVTYVLYADEGHGFARPENRLSFNAVAEVFLAQCLGGPDQPVGGDFKGSSIAVPAGADQVYGLSEALKTR